MFNLFKKTIHESEHDQIEELKSEAIGTLALAGENCDSITGGIGEFGFSYNNPIPVNGDLGTYKYLAKLCSPSLHKLFFHRLGSLPNEINDHPIDAYEVVNFIGTIWDIIFIDFYHPRRSNLAPQGYSLKPYDKKIGDMPFAFGVNIYCNDFPNDLPDKIKTHNGLIAFARKVSSSIQENNFSAPESHKLKVITIESKIVGRK